MLLPMVKFHAQIWQVGKFRPYLPGTLVSDQILKQSVKAHGPLVLIFQEKKTFSDFLALLDSVSRAHGMGLLSVVRPWRSYL